VPVHRLTVEQARRVAIGAQRLDADRPAALVPLVEQLTFLQIDPTAAIAPSADLVAWSRLGAAYEPDHLRRALEEDRTLFELNALIRPMSDLPIYLASMANARGESGGARQWLERNDRFRRDVLAVLRERGPLQSRDIPDTHVVPWSSTGWTANRNVTQMLELIAMRGEVAIAGRRGRQRVWDLAERVYPPGVEAVPLEEAQRLRDARRLRALGIARAKAPVQAMEPIHVGDTGEPAVVEGIEGEWRVDPEALERPFTGRTALLSPFDRLIHDRARTSALFGFEYVLEMYKPAAKRRWGYFALPILHHDRLVGKLDAAADRKAGVLRVNAIHADVPFTPAIAADVDAEIEALADWLGLTVAR
jgi:uncharacterized protein YcaQ